MLLLLQGIFVLLSGIIPENNGQQTITLPVEFHTAVSLPCSCSIRPEITNVVQWYRSSNASNTRAIAWWGRGIRGNSPGFGINDDFSMVIERVNLTNQGLYRCFVASVGGDTQHTCYVKLDVYANPYSPPLIEYSLGTNEIKVTCSISHVFPPTFPKLTSYEGNGTTEINEDGTYSTSVSHLFPLTDNDIDIQCLYSNANFKSLSSLIITDCPGQPTTEVQLLWSESSPTFSWRCNLSGLWIVRLAFVPEIFTLIIIVVFLHKTDFVMRSECGRSHHVETRVESEEINMEVVKPVDQSKNERMKHETHHEETCEEMEKNRGRNDQPVDQNKHSTVWPVIVIALHVTVIILLAAYLGITDASKM